MLKRVKARFQPPPRARDRGHRIRHGPLARLAGGARDRAAHPGGPLPGRRLRSNLPRGDKSGRTDGTWPRADVEWDLENDRYICPEGHELTQFRRNYSDPDRGPTGKGTARDRALEEACRALPVEAPLLPRRQCPQDHPRGARRRPRHRQDRRLRHVHAAQEDGRDAVRPPSADPRARPPPTTRAVWRERRIPPRRPRPEPPKAREDLPALPGAGSAPSRKADQSASPTTCRAYGRLVFTKLARIDVQGLCLTSSLPALSGHSPGRSSLRCSFPKPVISPPRSIFEGRRSGGQTKPPLPKRVVLFASCP